jgi:hypothetical protein
MRRRPWSHAAGGVGACMLVVLTAGCSGGPPVIETTDLSPAQAQACRDLVSDLPDTLAGQSSVEVEGDTAYGAAWGDPAIVLTCGVPPMDLSDVLRCTEADGVGWLVPDDELAGDRDATFTADGWRPRVRLLVPEDYLPEGGAQALAELAGPIKKHLELAEPCL